MNTLEKILSTKKEEVKKRLSHITGNLLSKQHEDIRVPRSFLKPLRENFSIIAEVKKASPSKGVIRKDFHPFEIAKDYEENGASCISVLTDEKFFQGKNTYLSEIKQQVSLPLLRKDFIIDAKQIRESYELGADAILLIVAALEKNQLTEFLEIAKSFSMDILVETHTEEEIETALEVGSDLIGINNRNLKSFTTSLDTSLRLKQAIPESVLTVSESGIKTTEDIAQLQKAGFNAILIGETLMREKKPGKALKELMQK